MLQLIFNSSQKQLLDFLRGIAPSCGQRATAAWNPEALSKGIFVNSAFPCLDQIMMFY